MDAVFRPVDAVARRFTDDESIQKLKQFKDEGLDVNAKDAQGFTALMEACVLGREKIVEYLLSIDVDVNRTNWYDGSALTCVCSFVFRTVDIANIVKMLLAAGANPNQRVDEGRGKDCLMLAVMNHNHRIVKLLIDAGADLTHRDLNNKTAMDYANERNDTAVLQVLQGAINISTERD
jgi:ankyrin repeat protein